MPVFFCLQMIDEFTDVNRGEKEMMKLWNLFAMEQGYSYAFFFAKYSAKYSSPVYTSIISNLYMSKLHFPATTNPLACHCFILISTYGLFATPEGPSLL